MTYYKRNIEKILKNAIKQFRVIVLSGSRQTGKSTLLKHSFLSTHKYISLDDPKVLKLAKEDPELFFQEYRVPIIIDEIQYAPELLHYIKMHVDNNPGKGQFILTGSQQFTLIKGLQETLAGRAGLFQLLPMSIDEGSTKTQNYKYRALIGSYPELITDKNPDPERWFASYINTYIEKDIQSIYRLEKITYFKDLLFLLAARTSQILNYNALAQDLGVSAVIIKSWVKILEASNIIYLLKPYYLNLGSRIIKSPKIYFTDIGLVSYITGNKNETSLLQGPQSGALFENFIIQEILKIYINFGIAPPLYYYRSSNGLEVDLIIEEKAGHLKPCEIKLSKTPHPGMASSIKRLRELAKNKNIKMTKGAIISMASQSFPLNSNDRVYPWTEFLQNSGDMILNS